MAEKQQSNLLTNFALHLALPETDTINWPIATAIAFDSSPNVNLKNRQKLQETYHETVSFIEPLIGKISGLPIASASHVVVCDRHEWIVNISDSIADFFDEAALPLMQGKLSSALIASEIGLLLGFLSQRVLGQYDTGLSRNGQKDLLFIVEPNIILKEMRLDMDNAPIRLWIIAHELTHRLQFQNISFLRDYYFDLIEEGNRLIENKLKENKSMAALTFNLITDPYGRRLMAKIQALMSFIEGYADFVMFEVGKMLSGYNQLAPIFLREQPSSDSILKKFLEKALGFEMKKNQYRLGLKFVSHISKAKGIDFINKKINSPADIPTLEEMSNPQLWVERI